MSFLPGREGVAAEGSRVERPGGCFQIKRGQSQVNEKKRKRCMELAERVLTILDEAGADSFERAGVMGIVSAVNATLRIPEDEQDKTLSAAG